MVMQTNVLIFKIFDANLIQTLCGAHNCHMFTPIKIHIVNGYCLI